MLQILENGAVIVQVPILGASSAQTMVPPMRVVGRRTDDLCLGGNFFSVISLHGPSKRQNAQGKAGARGNGQ